MNHSFISFAVLVFTAFFAIMNPIANTSVFVGLVSDFDSKTKRSISLRACLTAFIIVTLFVLFGKYIFEMFGLTIPAFKIAGGILIFHVGFEMLQSKKSSHQDHAEVPADKGIAISPLAIPILAGPGTIVTAMNYVANNSLTHMAIIIGAFALLLIITHIMFISSDYIVNLLGKNFLLIVGKIMGLVLSIIGTSMVIEGIKLAFHLPK